MYYERPDLAVLCKLLVSKNVYHFQRFVWLVFFFFPLVSDVFPDIRGTLMGEGVVVTSLRGTYCGFCQRLPVSAVSGASTNSRGLPPIITEGCSLMGWKCSTGCLPMHSSDNVGLRICTGQAAPDIPVRCEVITYCLTTSTNIVIAPGPLTTNV